MAKIQNTDIPNADEDLDQQKLLFSARGIRNDTATMETTLTVSYKTKYILTIHMIQQLYFLVFTQSYCKCMSTQKPEHHSLWQ